MKTFGFKVTTEMEKNLARIADTIAENRYEKDGPFRITNMLKACINVNMSSELEEMYKMLDKDKTVGMQIISIKNNLM